MFIEIQNLEYNLQWCDADYNGPLPTNMRLELNDDLEAGDRPFCEVVYDAIEHDSDGWLARGFDYRVDGGEWISVREIFGAFDEQTSRYGDFVKFTAYTAAPLHSYTATPPAA